MANGLNNSGFITISDAFTKGFVGGYNQIFTPTAYSNYLRNCRLENQGICMRDGYRVLTSIGKLGEFIKLKATERFLYALIIPNGASTPLVHLYKILPTGAIDLGSIGTITSANPADFDIVAVGELLIILTRMNRPYYYDETHGLRQIPRGKLPSIDGGTSADTTFSSSTGAYYGGFVFINEIDPETQTPTNRVIVSHEINRDQSTTARQDNAINFSAREDADQLIIPYKIVCPSSVQAIISTQQNLYIFCQDSVQYLDKEILMEYATNKTLRTIPLASGNSLMSKNCCIGAGNFVFFMCKDKHIRSLGYTSGIYDPQIADLTDTQFGIQKWINDNIDDEQSGTFLYSFAFFNKQDYTVEFHLRDRQATFENNITLIRDLQHQQWLIDNGKHFTCMENYDWSRTSTNDTPTQSGTVQTDYNSGIAHVIAGGLDCLYYQSDAKYDTEYDSKSSTLNEVNPIEFEYNTVNMALGEIAERKLFNGVRMTGAINIYIGNTDGIEYDGNTAVFEVNVYVDGKQICNKTLNWQQIYDSHQRYQLEVGGPQTEDFDPTEADSIIKYRRLLFPIDLVLDQGMVRRKGKRIRVQVISKTPGADLYLSGLSIRATPIGHFDLSDKF